VRFYKFVSLTLFVPPVTLFPVVQVYSWNHSEGVTEEEATFPSVWFQLYTCTTGNNVTGGTM
jgi:hypothetical protein